jgi:hypothetical protein
MYRLYFFFHIVSMKFKKKSLIIQVMHPNIAKKLLMSKAEKIFSAFDTLLALLKIEDAKFGS